MQDMTAAIADKPRYDTLHVDSTLEDTMLDISRVQALRALKAAQANAVKNGLCNMTLEEINATIAAARAERKPR